MTTASDRDTRGRFAPGNPGGPGGRGNRLAQRRQAFVDAITQEELIELAKTLYRLANAGDVAAAKLLLSYAIGAPRRLNQKPAVLVPLIDPEAAREALYGSLPALDAGELDDPGLAVPGAPEEAGAGVPAAGDGPELQPADR